MSKGLSTYLIGFLLLGLFTGGQGKLAMAQQPPSPGQDPAAQGTQPDSKNQDQLDQERQGLASSSPANAIEYSSAAPPTAGARNVPVIRAMGSASPLEAFSRLRWGSLYLGTAEFVQVYSTVAAAGDQPSTASNISLLRSLVYFDRQLRRGRLALQYQPRVMVVNGRVVNDFLNQNLGFDTYYVLSPRWVMGLGERFYYYDRKNVFGDSFLDSDSVSGTVVQNSFLEGPGSWLSSSTGASFSYLMSARTRISIDPSFTFSRSSRGNLEPGASSRSYNLHNVVTYDRSARQTIGAYYNFQLLTSNGSFQRTIYQAFGGSLVQRVTPTLSVNGSIGLATSDFRANRHWSTAMTLGAVKAFSKSHVGLAYYRGQTVSGYVSNHLGERVDVQYVTRLTERFQTGFWIGYLRELDNPNAVWGRYMSTRFTYRLAPEVRVVATYVYKWQNGSTPEIFTGRNHFFEFGISWSPIYSAR
jgi:hypothetical protein